VHKEIHCKNCYFFTATIYKWYRLLIGDKYKKIITDSLAFLVKEKRVVIYAFIIMPNHINLIWDIQPPHTRSGVQRDFLKFTAQMIKLDLMKNYPCELPLFRVNSKDRLYRFWQRRPMSIHLYTLAVFEQKLNYIHRNPVSGHWNLAKSQKDYKYSSAAFYADKNPQWTFLTNFYLEQKH